MMTKLWLKYFIALSLFFLSGTIFAETSTEKKAAAEIAELYHKLALNPNWDMQKRLEFISAYFLGRPYILGSLGEGKDAYYDQMPLCRTDGFDCETYVTSVLALALANNGEQYMSCLKKIRYFQGKVQFIYRNHFTGLDWNTNNQKAGFVKDITTSIVNGNTTIYKMASAVINKPAWYQHFSVNNIRLRNADKKEQQKRLQALQKEGSQLPITTETVPYLPLDVLFDSDRRENEAIFAQIPNAAIIELVRPDWNLTPVIGTNLNISHLGFVFRQKNQLIFREASSVEKKIIDVALIEYLRNLLDSPTVKGINIQVVVPQKAIGEECLL